MARGMVLLYRDSPPSFCRPLLKLFKLWTWYAPIRKHTHTHTQRKWVGT